MDKADTAISVLFVCMGNICRSPTGEGVFRHYVEEHGLAERIAIDSAGTIGYHTGKPADARMQEAAAARGYRLESLARQVTRQDIDAFDLVVAMDVENLENLYYLAESKPDNIRMLGSFLDVSDDPVMGPSVPDPYYGGAAGFEAVLDMIEAACPSMLAHCRSLLEGD